MKNTPEKGFCNRCNTMVTYHQVPINHRAHLRTTLFTLGIWAPFWLLISLSKHCVCNTCGENVSVY